MFKKVCIALGALAIVGCSASQSDPFQVFLKNLSAAQCDNPTALLSNIPLGVLTQAQAMAAVNGFCAGMFGTAPAPAPAPGNSPAIK